MTLQATLYTKAGCHLCEAAERDLARLQRRYPHTLQLVDVTADAGLLERYGERIPVLQIVGREYAAPLEPALLERALKQATAALAALTDT